jgi:hypothetical protein
LLSGFSEFQRLRELPLLGIAPTDQAGAQRCVVLEGVPMRPLFSLWSDYGTPTRKYRISLAARSARPVRKIFLTAVIVAAAVIGMRERYGQAVDKRRVLEPAAHPQSLMTPSASPTGRRSASIAVIPLSPQHALSMDNAGIVSPASVPPPEPSPRAAPAMAAGVAGDYEIPPALAAIPGAQAKAGALPRTPAALTAMKSADGPRSAGARRIVHVARHTHGDGRGFAGYAETIARLGHSKELRAALQLFL